MKRVPYQFTKDPTAAKTYWRSLDEAADNASLNAAREREFEAGSLPPRPARAPWSY